MKGGADLPGGGADTEGLEAARSQLHWEVVGGSQDCGIMVRDGQALTSQVAGRLSLGARVRQLQLEGHRLQYSLVTGTGPETGWVSLEASGKTLVVRAAGRQVLESTGEQAAAQELPPTAAQAHARIFVFDWDDTLLPHTWLSERGLLKPDLRHSGRFTAWEHLLAGHAAAVEQLLSLGQSLGEVAVVTLGQSNWVSWSAQGYLPQVFEQVMQLQVFSARDLPTGKMPLGEDPQTMKKKHAMRQAVDALAPEPGMRLDLVSIGDSFWEKRAAEDLGKEWPSRIKQIKTIKLKEQPTIEELTRQLQALHRRLADFVFEEGSRHLRAADLM